ncbi:MAG: hypothetical protein AAFW73_13115 [Bacteroidota bacterium]
MNQCKQQFGIRPFLLLLACWGCWSSAAHAEVTYSIPLLGYEHQIGNMLEWSTAQEANSQMFIVEKSSDGIAYENIGVVNAAGASADERSYRYLDINATTDKVFYRLRQVDTDGTGSFSQTVLVKRQLANQFMVVAMSNTTTNGDFDLTLDAIIDGVLDYEVVTLQEETVATGQLALEFGLNDLHINLADEREGAYRIRLRLEQEEEALLIRKANFNTRDKENVASKKPANGG